MSIALAAAAAALFSCGTYLLLQRTLTRIILGIALLGHGTVLILQVAGGRAGDVPLVGPDTEGASVVDPLPHALALTAIVITFGITAFLLALAYRSWALTHDDEVQDDLEDLMIARVVELELARAAEAAAEEPEDLSEFDPEDLAAAEGRDDRGYDTIHGRTDAGGDESVESDAPADDEIVREDDPG